MPFFTYWLSVWTTTWHGRFSASSAIAAAVSSMRLLVVVGLGAGQFLDHVAERQDRRPAAGSGIGLAAAIGPDLHHLVRVGRQRHHDLLRGHRRARP